VSKIEVIEDLERGETHACEEGWESHEFLMGGRSFKVGTHKKIGGGGKG